MFEEGEGAGDIPGGGGDTGSGGGGGAEQSVASGARPSAEHEWKRRAETAEARVEELEEQVGVLKARSVELESALSTSEQRRQIDRHLSQAEAVDVETAALLTEAAVAGMDEPDVARAVAELRDRKPFLFGRRERMGSGMSAFGSVGDPVVDELDRAAIEARESGDKRTLLRYLRMRRGAC